MRLLEWLRPGINVKRWFVIGFMGIFAMSFGIARLIWPIYKSIISITLSIVLIICGLILVFFAIVYGINTILTAIDRSNFNISLDKEKLKSLLLEKRILIKGPKIVAIGGGTGLSTMLRGLKEYSSNITAVVTVADNGGSSGRLRQELGILPPGDIRNCILALADTEPIMEKLLQYRFDDGELKGHSFGNLFLAAMSEISDNFEDAVKKMSDVLAVTGRVLPVTLESINLCAELQDGAIVKGEPQVESATKTYKQPIKRVFIEPSNVAPLPEVLSAIEDADVIILGPGSLYTSVIANLLVEGVPEAIKKANALKIYVCNIMTQPGETDGYTVSEHIKQIFKHSKDNLIDYCIVNNKSIPQNIKELYKEEGGEELIIDREEITKLGISIIEDDLLSIKKDIVQDREKSISSKKLVRHDTKKLSEIIIKMVNENIFARDRKRVIDYFYMKDRLKKN